jgi:hypothetical protein
MASPMNNQITGGILTAFALVRPDIDIQGCFASAFSQRLAICTGHILDGLKSIALRI